MITIHIVTFLIYLVSVIILYIFDWLYTKGQTKADENQFYVAMTISFMLNFVVQCVLIYIFKTLIGRLSYQKGSGSEVTVEGAVIDDDSPTSENRHVTSSSFQKVENVDIDEMVVYGDQHDNLGYQDS